MRNFLKVFYLTAFISGFAFKGFGQAALEYKRLTSSIDSFASMGLPKSALDAVNKLDEFARNNKNIPQQIKATIYRMTFQSYLEENALEAVINQLKRDIGKSHYPVTPVLQSLLAETYWRYYQQNRYQFRNRSVLEKPDADFTRWDLKTTINEVTRLYRLSLAESFQEQRTSVNVLEGVLIGDSTTRYLRPTLYDLLAHRALDFFLSEEPDLPRPKLPFSIKGAGMFANNQDFANAEILTGDTSSTSYQGIKLLQELTRFHLERNEESALADLNLKRLGFVFRKSVQFDKDDLYIAGLKEVVGKFSDIEIGADALARLGQYYQQKDSLRTAKSYLDKAAKLFPKSMAAKNARVLISQIEKKEIAVTVENMNIPSKPILAILHYRNLKEVKYMLYRLSAKKLKEISALNEYDNRGRPEMIRPSVELKNYLDRQEPFRDTVVKLIDLSDYRKHTTEFKIDPLEAGTYLMLAKDPSSDDYSIMHLAQFEVSKLDYSARIDPFGGMEVRTFHRETGYPLSGVEVTLKTEEYKLNRYNEIIIAEGKSDKNGRVYFPDIKDRNPSVTLSIAGETLRDDNRYIYGARSHQASEENIVTLLFTDRQLYRPGQTIYFKGLQLLKTRTESKIVVGEDVEITFNDANQKEISTLNFKTNEFGTFSGSFIVPQATLNGRFTIETDNGSIAIQVEEYKRPTFQVAFDPVKESYRLNDKITLNGKVTAFSGYGLSQATVNYRITRGTTTYKTYQYGYFNSETEITSDTLKTNSAGEFTISFNAIPGESSSKGDLVYIYRVTADVTDANGETRSSLTNIAVGGKTFIVNFPFEEKLFTADTIKIPVSLNNLNSQLQKGVIKVKVYSLISPERTFINRVWTAPDLPVMRRDEFFRWFPYYEYKNEKDVKTWTKNKLTKEFELNTTAEKFSILDLTSLTDLPSASYRLEFFATNIQGDTTSATSYIEVITEPSVPIKTENWVVPVKTIVAQGEAAEFYVGLGQESRVLMETFDGEELLSSEWLSIGSKQQLVKIPMSKNRKHFSVQFLTAFQNRILTSYHVIRTTKTDKLDIRFVTFRDKLQPGDKEKWKLQVNGKDKQAAEMVASLYDASLDDITAGQRWAGKFNSFDEIYTPNYFVWNIGTPRAVNSTPFSYSSNNFVFLTRQYETLDLLGFDYTGGVNHGYNRYLQQLNAKARSLEHDRKLKEEYQKKAALVKNGFDVSGQVTDENGRVLPGVAVIVKGRTNIGTTTNSEGYFRMKVPAGSILTFAFLGYKRIELATQKNKELSIQLKGDGAALNEVVVVGYSTQKKESFNGAISTVVGEAAGNIQIIGTASIAEDNSIRDFASIEVLGKMVASMTNQTKAISVRQNFNETAFFYPQLRTNANGEILIEFTIPESLTRWRFMGFAHTKKLQSGYIEEEVVTQKSLMISANMPRFFREGDTISISARLANLTDKRIKGNAQLQLFNALTMQPVMLLANLSQATQSFDLERLSNKAVSFKMIIPPGLEAITYRLTADADKFSDGEENTIPVLPNSMLVMESMPMMVRAGQTKSFTLEKLVNNKSTTLKSKNLVLEYTQNPVWYAVQALPYLMEFPYECSEQVFSRYFANTLAGNIIQRLPRIKATFEQWKNLNSGQLLSNLEKNPELKSVLIEETPWLQEAVSETEQKKRIALLFDLNKMSNELELNLMKLSKMQRADGGFPWFSGSRYSDRYITQHIMAGMGRLIKLADVKQSQSFKAINNKALAYLDNELIKEYKNALKAKIQGGISSLTVHALYVRSYFPDIPSSSNLKSAINYFLAKESANWKFKNVYEQSLMAFTLHRYNQPESAKAIIRSLSETAQQSEELGMYWAKNVAGYYWYESPVETQALLIELFSETASDQKAIEEMKIWLLRNKQTNNWKTTKATASACYALLLRGQNLLESSAASAVILDGQPLEILKPGIKAEAGSGYIKAAWNEGEIQPGLGKVTVKNTADVMNWGALHWQYLEKLDRITSGETQLKLERKYFIQKYTDSGPEITEVNDNYRPKTGDVLKVVVYLNADRDYEYVQLKDMRPSGTEPSDILSGYKYQENFYYYQVTKDVATNFFISNLPKGKYVFEYNLRVVQPGNFSTGISSVQCLYAPEFNAHSEGKRLIIE